MLRHEPHQTILPKRLRPSGDVLTSLMCSEKTVGNEYLKQTQWRVHFEMPDNQKERGGCPQTKQLSSREQLFDQHNESSLARKPHLVVISIGKL